MIVYDGDDSSTEATVSVMDAESTDRLIQWFRQRPKASGDLESKIIGELESKIVQQFESAIGERFGVPTLRIQTDRCRASFLLFSSRVVLETRDSDADEWRQASWEMRQEDVDLRDWALLQVKENYLRNFLDRAVLDADSEIPDVERAGMSLHSDDE